MAEQFRTKLGNVRIKDGAAKSLMVGDSIANVITGLGGSLDPQQNNFYYVQPIERHQIEASYRSSWVTRKVIDLPALEMVRAWRGWKGDDAQVGLLEKEERRLGLREKVRRAEVLSRLYGGSCIMLGTGDADLSQPLNVAAVKRGGLRYLHVLSRHEVQIPAIDMDPGSEFYLQPTGYVVNNGQTTIHPSRMVRFVSNELPDTISAGEYGWGDSTLVAILSAISNADTIQATFAALAAKAKVDTITIPDLPGQTATAAGEENLKKRVMIAKAFEVLFNVKLINGPANANDVGEKWETFQVSFNGQPELMMAFLQMVAGAADLPMTRLVGMSPGGLNSTGDSDERNYFQNISAGQELKLRPRLEMIDEVLIRSALGNRPEDLYFWFLPLAIESDGVKAANAKLRAEATKIYAETGTVPTEVLMEAVKGQLIDSGEYPSIEGAYDDYDASGNVLEIETPEEPANDNGVMSAAIEGMVSRGSSASTAARDAVAMLTDAAPMPLYVHRPLLSGGELAAWARDNGLNPISPDKMRVTVAYSKAPVDWMKVGSDDWDADGVKVIGGPRMLERFGPEKKTIVLLFSSSRLGYRHEEILRAGASFDWPEYQPHVTIDYDAPDDIDIDAIKPFSGELRFGTERFERLDEDWKEKLDD